MLYISFVTLESVNIESVWLCRRKKELCMYCSNCANYIFVYRTWLSEAFGTRGYTLGTHFCKKAISSYESEGQRLTFTSKKVKHLIFSISTELLLLAMFRYLAYL